MPLTHPKRGLFQQLSYHDLNEPPLQQTIPCFLDGAAEKFQILSQASNLKCITWKVRQLLEKSILCYIRFMFFLPTEEGSYVIKNVSRIAPQIFDDIKPLDVNSWIINDQTYLFTLEQAPDGRREVGVYLVGSVRSI
jgi:hypothetical protein